MIHLYVREDCPHCHRIRDWLGRRGLDFHTVPVPKLMSQRVDVIALVGESPEVPVLEDHDTVVQGEALIMAYLEERYGRDQYPDAPYGLTRNLGTMDFEDAKLAVMEALAGEGFGVLTEIDVKATLRKKLDADFRPYLILGACNPPLAHQALSMDLALGLLLPCNVVLTQEDDGSVVVSAIDPIKMFSIVSNPALEPVAKVVKDKLVRVLDSVQVS